MARNALHEQMFSEGKFRSYSSWKARRSTRRLPDCGRVEVIAIPRYPPPPSEHINAWSLDRDLATELLSSLCRFALERGESSVSAVQKCSGQGIGSLR
jgi:hypothetical protein